MKVLYFAWLRERIGESEEVVATDGLTTVADLIAALKTRSDGHAMAFADTKALRVAVNQKVAGFDAPLDGVEEIAFFPPMTGG